MLVGKITYSGQSNSARREDNLSLPERLCWHGRLHLIDKLTVLVEQVIFK